MSRIGNKHIEIPSTVTVTVNDATVTVKGPKGEISRTFEKCIKINQENNVLTFVRENDEKHTKQMHGTTRAIVNNMIVGVQKEFEKVLLMTGTGYRTEYKNDGSIVLFLGYSHTIPVIPPAGIKFSVPNQTEIHVTGIDKELVGQIAAEIRSYRGPEPYKGKGIRYSNEVIRRKEVKKAK